MNLIQSREKSISKNLNFDSMMQLISRKYKDRNASKIATTLYVAKTLNTAKRSKATTILSDASTSNL